MKLSTKHFAAIAAVAILTACGGGGGGDSESGGGSGGSVQSRPIVTTPPASTYTQEQTEKSLFDELNRIRIAGGFGALAQSAALDDAAFGHLEYTRINNVISHNQDPSLPGFTGVDPMARATAKGYVGSVSESIGGPNIGAILGTVYHGIDLLRPWTDVGMAVWDNEFGGRVVIKMGAESHIRQLPAGDTTVNVHPSQEAGAVGGTFYAMYEVPRPPQLVPDVAGTSVHVSLWDVGYATAAASGSANVRVTRFELRDANAAVVPSVVLMPNGYRGTGAMANDPLVAEGFVTLVPNAPLAVGTYTASFEAEVNGRTRSRTWTFTVDRVEW